MPKKVYNNFEDFRVLDGNAVCEDVTSVALPTITHPTTTISASGMAAAVEMPDMTRVEAMEFGISHNNGENCKRLATPGNHTIQVRAVRQRYNAAKAVMEHESVKWNVTGVHTSSEKGNVENGNPYGTTDKYSVLRYEEIVNGSRTVLIDAVNGIVEMNGKRYTDQVQNLLK